jgi:hypothetical protein
MSVASRRILEYPFHSRLSRLAWLMLGVALLWIGSGQLTVTGLMLMFSGLVIAVSAVQPPRSCLRSPDRAAYADDNMDLTPARSYR